MTFFENRSCVDSHDLVALWRAWENVPLKAAELDAVGALFKERWRGMKDSVVFMAGTQRADETKAALRLDPALPVWALFTSNLDEAGGTNLANGVFETHGAWVLASIDFARRHPGIQLVIRVHPNSGSQRSFAKNAQELAFYESLTDSLPDNVRLVRSDDTLNSYALAAMATVGLTWHSTIGVEMAALGKPVVRCGSREHSAQPCLLMPETPAAYARMLGDLIQGRAPDPLACARPAWRFGVAAFFRYSFPFPLVKQTDWYMGDMNFSDYSELAPGKDVMLDRICAHIMDRAPLHPTPPERGAAEASAETDAILRWISAAQPGAEPARA
jgi:hypothetical protein